MKHLINTHAGIALMLASAVLAARPQPTHAQPSDDQAYRAGIGLLSKGLNDLAAAELRTYLDQHPDGEQATHAHYALAVCLTRQGKTSDALPHLERAAAADDFEFAPDALLLLAQCQQTTGNDEASITTLRKLTAAHAGFKQVDRATLLLGEALYRTGESQEAAALLEQVRSRWPQSTIVDRAELFTALAEATSDPRAAAERAARLRKEHPRSEHLHHAALIEARCRQRLTDTGAARQLFELAAAAKGPVRAEALLGLAALARTSGNLGEAATALEQLQKEPLTEPLREWMALEKGKLLLKQNDAPAAARLFREVRRSSDPALQADAALWFARCQARQGKFAEAISNLENAAAQFAGMDLVPEMLFERAAVLGQSGDDRAAFEAWSEWVEHYPTHALTPDAKIAQAWTAHRLGRFDDSVQLLASVTKGAPERAHEETTSLLIAENAFARGDYETALNAYGALIERHPKGVHAWRSAARRVLCLAELDRAGEASAALEAALSSSLTPDSGLRRAALTRVAELFFTRSDWKNAETWFSRLATDLPAGDDRSDAQLRHALSMQRQGKFAEAAAALDAIASHTHWSGHRQARFELGQCLLQLSRLEEARAAFEKVAAGDAEDSLLLAARRHLASIASRQGRHAEAADILAAAPRAAGATQLELGSAYLAAGKYEDALEALDHHLETPKASDTVKARALRGIALTRLAQHDRALKDLSDASGDPSLDADLRGSVAYELATALRATGREEEAVAALRDLAATGPARLAAYARLDLAQIELRSERYELAVRMLEDCLSGAASLAAPEAAAITERATYLRASCLLRAGRPKEAADSLKAFAETYPSSTLLGPARLVRGEALLATGLAREAADELARAAEDNRPDVRSAASLRLGEAWAGAQEWARSDEAFTRFLDREAESPMWFQARFGQGWARENQGRHDAAIECYREVIARHDGPTAARAQFQVGECLYAQKKLDSAIAEFLKTDVLYAYPEWSAAALFEAGRCLEELGRAADATRQHEDLITRFPDSHWARLAKDRRQSATPAPVPGQAPRASTPAGTSPTTPAANLPGR